MAGTPGWTTVPAAGDSGWEVYRPEAPHRAAPAPKQAPPPPPPLPPTTPPQRATPVHHTGARHPQHARPPATSRIVVKPDPAGAVLAATRPAPAPGYAPALVLAALLAAIACLASASAPTLRWRRGAFFVADNRVAITSTGAACLLAAAILFALTR